MLAFFSVEYLAPEVVLKVGHDGLCDIWALGVTIYELTKRSTPFSPPESCTMTDILDNIKNTLVSALSLYLALFVLIYTLT